MNEIIFVDTNVLVYARDASEPEKQHAAAGWLSRLWREQQGRVSVQVLNEYYVTTTRKLKPGLPADDAWDDVRAFMAWEPQSIDSELLLRTREVEQRYQLSWWDSMIVAAAQLQGCTTLLTEDLQHGMVFGGLTVRDPFRTEVHEVAAAYEVAPLAVARHRSRGRPRRAVRSPL